ncbi:unnamed protein product [Rhizophagus irregularis]|nr:unnamed protein product [Rhizophagus irregularis]
METTLQIVLPLIRFFSLSSEEFILKANILIQGNLYLPYEFKLLLRGSQNGFTPKKFHELCDNIPYTATIIKVKGTGEILGGYNPLVWKSHDKGEWVMDKALFYHSECGPAFNDDLCLSVQSNE